MNEYYNDWRARENQQGINVSEALEMIMSKMEGQQEKLQRQLQRNQDITDRGIENTQQRISNMHKDIQNIQQEVRETNLEVQSNKDEIKQLQERQSKLESQQDNVLTQTQKELEKAQEEIKQMRVSLEQMDEDMEARDEEIEEMQDELMEARKNLNRVEAHNRRGNLKIYGIPEHQGEDREDCTEVAIKLLNDYMPGHDWEAEQVEKAHRLGKYIEGGRARPILVKMVNPQDTYYILGSKESRGKMKQDNIHISQDLTRDQQDILKQEKDKGNLAYFVGVKLVVREGEGKYFSRDSSRGRRRDRGRVNNRDRESESESSNFRNKRDRQGSTLYRDHSREQSRVRPGTRSRLTQETDQDSTQRPAKPWRFGDSQRKNSTSPTSRYRRGQSHGDKDQEEGNTFKKPMGTAYRANRRPPHRNPYRYQSRSVSGSTRNASPPGSRSMSTHKNNQNDDKNSGRTSPSTSTSATNSPAGSKAGSNQGSRNPSRHSSRSSSQQHTPSNKKESGKKDTQDTQEQQRELEELRERLKQLSEETPNKSKSVSKSKTFTNSNWQSPKDKRAEKYQSSNPVSFYTQSGKSKHDTTDDEQEKQKGTQHKVAVNQTSSGNETELGKQDRITELAKNYAKKLDHAAKGMVSKETCGKSSDNELSPDSKQPTKRQKTTYRRYGLKATEERKSGPSNTNPDSVAQSGGEFRTSRPRARVYSGRRFRSQTLRRMKALHKDNQVSSSLTTPRKSSTSTSTLSNSNKLDQKTPCKERKKSTRY